LENKRTGARNKQFCRPDHWTKEKTRMTRRVALYGASVFVVALVVGVFASMAGAANPSGRPSGWHYNLELIAVPNPKTNVDGLGSNGHRIFIDLSGSTKILLSEGNFQVIDFNGTDGQASFALPANPCIDAAGNVVDCPVNAPEFQCYSVWIAELGKPCDPTLANDTACAILKTCGDQTCVAGACSLTGLACLSSSDCNVCSTENVMLVRNAGKPNWRDVTKELTTICVDFPVGGNSCDIRVPIFDDSLADAFWSIDNAGLRHAQIRFYPEEGDVCGLKPSSK